MTYIEPLRTYIADNHLDGRAELESDTPLLEWGIIDSLAVSEIMAFIEDRFGVYVPPSEVTPENFGDLAALAAMIERLQAARV